MDAQKQKVVAGAMGAAFALGFLALGYFLYDAFSVAGEAGEELENAESQYRRYKAAAVYPSLKSIAGVKTNAAVLAAWTRGAYDRVKAGDRSFPEETPPIFKQRLQREVKRLGALAGGAEGRLAKPEFLFGFDKYLGENGILPAAEDLAVLAADLDAAATFATLLSQAGVQELTGCQAVAPAAKDGERDGEAKPKPGAKRGKAAKAAGKEAGDGPKPVSRAYRLAFLARPDALVKALNSLTSDPRFMVVGDLAFRETVDTIVTRFAAEDEAKAKKLEAARNGAGEGTGRRRRRRGGSAEDGAGAAEKKPDRLVVDPELEAPLAVECTVTVWDFASAGAPAGGGDEKGGK